MKKILVVAALLVGISGSCLAKYALWNSRQKPEISLTQALSMAQKSLGKNQKDFYCVDAKLGVSLARGDWTLQFGSKNAGTRFVMVLFDDKTVRVSKSPFPH